MFKTANALIILAFLSMSVFAAPTALQLNQSNIAEFQSAGPDAIGGIGDWLLSSGTMCAVISDLKHETGLMAGGGALVDVYDCKAGNDQWSFQHFVPNVDKNTLLTTRAIHVVQSATEASVQVKAEGYGLELTTQYTMGLGKPSEMRVTHDVQRTAEGASLGMLGLLTLHPHMSLTPFSISTSLPAYSLGFEYPASTTEDMLSLVRAMVPADVHVLVGDAALSEVSYGIQLRKAELIDTDGEAVALPAFQQTADTYSMQGVLSRPPWLGGSGKLGVLEFAQSQWMDIDIGERIRLEQTIYLGARADVAAVSNQIYAGPTLSGSVASAAAVVNVFTEEGHAITSVRPSSDGLFSVRLPSATRKVSLAVKEPALPDSKQYDFALAGDSLNVGELSSGVPAQLRIENDSALRLTFVGQNGTPNPNFYAKGFNASFGGPKDPNIQKANYLNFAGTSSDPKTVSLAPGRYRVLASRGMAFGVTEQVINLSAGNNPALIVNTPKRELSTTGLLAADFHVHSAPSFDSYIAIDERLRGFVAQGGDVLVATEHNVLVDYREDLVRTGLQDVVNILSGTELTGMARTPSAPYTNGHLNVFPMQASPNQFAGGLPAHEGMRLRELFAALASEKDSRLFQLNHPRSIDPLGADQDSNYFDHLNVGQSYNPETPLSAEGNQSLIEKDVVTGLRDIDFDVLEVANGPYYDNYLRVREDWFSLLNQGERIVATANSDTHGNSYLVAIPQSYVQLAKYTESDFLKAVKHGKVFGTTGPLLNIELSGETGTTGMGEMASGLHFTLSVEVRAASWVPVGEMTVYLNGELYEQFPVERGQTIELPLKLAKDSYLVVQVTGKASELYELLAPDFVPFAFSNPIYIDADGDGKWIAPGLPADS
ncbi:MAG: CehA/McbA family metallohydrolase [Pseudomonadales bacterium]